MMMHILKNALPYLAGLGTLILGDLLWLGFIMVDFYQQKLGHLLAPEVTWWAAGVFYLVYTFGVLWFVVRPQDGVLKPVREVAMNGALYGALAYAVYDLTNQATLTGWPLEVTVGDILWGGFLTMLVAVAMRLVAGKGVSHG